MRVGRNDPCPCGSGKKYKKCCLNKTTEDKEHIPEDNGMSLRDRNLHLIDAATDVFGFNKGRTWADLKKDISGDQVREFYQHVASLWPPSTDLSKLLPEPGDSLRALYLGDVDPKAILNNVFRFALYSDEIFIVNPIKNPWCIQNQYNPLAVPDQYKMDTLKVVRFLFELAPWIDTGLVTLVPDPGDFDFSLRLKTVELAKKRLEKVSPDKWRAAHKEMMNSASVWDTDDTRLFLMAPKKHQAREIREFKPDITEEELERVLAHFDRQRTRDPIALEQPLDENGQFTSTRMGPNLEMSLYIAQATGAFPYTSIPFRWKELLSVGDDLSETAKIWTPLTKAFQGLRFKFLDNVDSKFACSIRTDGQLEGFRSFLRKVWKEVEGEPSASKIDNLVRDFRDELTFEYSKAQVAWDEIDKQLLTKFIPTAAGAVGALVSGNLQPAIAAVGLGVSQLLSAHSKRKNFRKETPMSVFIDLDQRK